MSCRTVLLGPLLLIPGGLFIVSDPDPYPAFHFDVDPDSTCHCDADPDPIFQFDPYLDHTTYFFPGFGCGSGSRFPL
jgi:hypothetical protein